MSTDQQPSTADIEAAQDALAHAEGESVRVPSNPVHKLLVGAFGALLTLTCLCWAGQVPYYLGTAFYQEQFLAVVLGLAIALAYNGLNWRGKPHATFSPIDSGSAWLVSEPQSGLLTAGPTCCRTCRIAHPKS